MRKAGLTANAKKCRIGLTETEYTIGRGCVKPQARKVERIRQWHRPLTKKQLKSLLELRAYYSQFIPRYATIAAPLYDLTSHARPNQLKWSGEAEEALKALQQEGTSVEGPRFHKTVSTPHGYITGGPWSGPLPGNE